MVSFFWHSESFSSSFSVEVKVNTSKSFLFAEPSCEIVSSGPTWSQKKSKICSAPPLLFMLFFSLMSSPVVRRTERKFQYDEKYFKHEEAVTNIGFFFVFTSFNFFVVVGESWRAFSSLLFLLRTLMRVITISNSDLQRRGRIGVTTCVAPWKYSSHE